jgi:colanic acid/amylovoran biosynthesis glycosyltransferase
MTRVDHRVRSVRLRIAYLCNVYPAVSHSFIRREIEAVERAGHQVYRFTIRPIPTDLRDESDLREAERTEAVLSQGLPALAVAAAILAAQRPVKTVRAMAMAFRLSAPGLKSKSRHLAYWLEAAWLIRRSTQLGIEHVHVHFGTNPTAVAAIVNAWGGPSFSFTAHGPDEFDAPIQLSLGKKIAASSFVAAISSFGRSQLMRWSDSRDWPKITVVRCGLGSDFLSQPITPIPKDSKEFVCVARLSPQKGLPLLISACAQLAKNGEQFTLTIIGEGELRSALQGDISRRGLEKHIRLVGNRSSAEIREHLQQCRAFVLPSFAEGLPVVIMEALALARPVITTAIAGIPELVTPECGWLLPAGSERALVHAMAQALRVSPDDLYEMGRLGRERVIEAHDASANANGLVKAVRRVSELTTSSAS